MHQAIGEIVEVHRIADLHIHPTSSQHRNWDSRLHQRSKRTDNHSEGVIEQSGESVDSSSHNLADRSAEIIGENLA